MPVRIRAAYLLLTLFSMLTLNNLLFVHAHLLPGGQYVVHAHPFSRNDDGTPKKHNHSHGQLIILDQISHPFFVTPGHTIYEVLLVSTEIRNSNFTYVYRKVFKNISYTLLRGPPF